MTLEFEALVGPHLKEMYRLALAIVGPDDAADVTQDALVAAWRGVGGLRDEARVRFWLHRIVVNRARDVIRERSRRPRSIRVLDPEAVTGASRPDSSAEVGERDRLDRAFETLTPDQRAILALHYTLDLSVDVAHPGPPIAVSWDGHDTARRPLVYPIQRGAYFDNRASARRYSHHGIARPPQRDDALRVVRLLLHLSARRCDLGPPKEGSRRASCSGASTWRFPCQRSLRPATKPGPPLTIRSRPRHLR